MSDAPTAAGGPAAAKDEAPLLTMRGLRVEATGADGSPIVIVDDVDLELQRGQVLGLIGESGAGKSTIALAAMGYTRGGARITGGEILFDGLSIRELPYHTRRRLRGDRIAYVAQSAAASFNPAKRLMDQIVESPVLHGVMSEAEARERALDLFHRLQVPDPETFGLRYPHQVSGGQLQRAMTAMAMVCCPDVLILDEPTTALDVTTQIEVLAAVRDVLHDFGTAGLYITHDLAVVAQISDRIMVLQHGRKVEEGEARQILEEPREAYTRDLVAARRFHVKPGEGGTTTPNPLLAVEGVEASYGAVRVLHGVDVEVHPRETVAVVGESGSGKSTLARVVTGLLPPSSGTVRFEGEALPPALAGRSRDQLRRIQMIYQMPDVALNPRHRVFDTLARPLQFYRGLRGTALREAVHALLDDIEMGGDFARRFPGELSGGQKQRVCIARALAAEPDLIICDEPTSALDQLVAEAILKLLQRLQDERGLAYLFITHDLGLVKAIADRVVVMKNGEVVQQGPKKQVFTPPAHPYTELLLASVPEMRVDWLDDVLRTRAGKELAER